MNNETFHGIPGARAYWTRMMTGASRIVDSLRISAEADSLSTLLPGGTTAISTGTSVAHFKLATGTEFDVPLRWSATLVKTGDTWQVGAAHFSADVFNNPVSGSVTRLLVPSLLVAGTLGLGLGWLVASRRRQRS
jgi:hypothetical protein